MWSVSKTKVVLCCKHVVGLVLTDKLFRGRGITGTGVTFATTNLTCVQCDATLFYTL